MSINEDIKNSIGFQNNYEVVPHQSTIESEQKQQKIHDNQEKNDNLIQEIKNQEKIHEKQDLKQILIYEDKSNSRQH